MTKLVKKIRASRELPLIGVIGATEPDNKYEMETGIEVGYSLRRYINSKGGSIFTGGVDGVGIDVYTGVMRFCVERASGGAMPDDRFFVVIPENGLALTGFDGDYNRYKPPDAYTRLAALTPRRVLDVVRAGLYMKERRVYMPLIADALVAVNGGLGTLDEACGALKASKKVLAFEGTGGAADQLVAIKKGRTNECLEEDLIKIGFRNPINPDLIHVARSIEEMIEELDKLL